MSDRQRHRAFAVSALFVVVVCVLVWLVERPPSGGGAESARSTRTRRPLVLGAEAGEPSAREAPRGSTREAPASTTPSPARRAEEGVPGEVPIVATARRFTAAFVKYEVGQLPVAVRRAIQSTATPSFAASLLSAPPSIPNGVRPPSPPEVRLVALANGPEAGQAAVVVELRGGGGEESTLTELLTKSGEEWRISGLG
jgi:hypothetical protein